MNIKIIHNNRYMRVSIVSFILIAHFLPTLVASKSESSLNEHGYLFNIPPTKDCYVLHFPIANTGIVYDNFLSAIEVVSVYCDGISVPPKIVVPAGSPSLLTKNISEKWVFYQTCAGSIDSWVLLSKDNDGFYKLKRFAIEYIKNSLVVNYICRYPDGRKSELNRVTYVVNNDDTRILATPYRPQ